MLRRLIVALFFVFTLVVNISFVNEIQSQNDSICSQNQIVEVTNVSSYNDFEDEQQQEVIVEVAYTFDTNFETSAIQITMDKADTEKLIAERAHAPPVKISFGSIVEARDRFFSDLERAADRTVDRTRHRIIRDTQRNIERRVNDHIRDQAELLDPESRTYQEFKLKKIINSLPYGKTRILVQGSIDAYAPDCVFIERKAIRLFERMIAEYSNIVIENDCYKKGRNGRRGQWVGFDVLKTDNANDIIVTR